MGVGTNPGSHQDLHGSMPPTTAPSEHIQRLAESDQQGFDESHPTQSTQAQDSSSLSSIPTLASVASEATAQAEQNRPGSDVVGTEDAEHTVLHQVLDKFKLLQSRLDTLEKDRNSPSTSQPGQASASSKGKTKAATSEVGVEGPRATAIPPHLALVDSDNPVEVFSRLQQGEKDAFRMLLRPFGINVTTFIDLMKDRTSAVSSSPPTTSSLASQPLTKVASEPIPPRASTETIPPRSSTPVASRPDVVGSTPEPLTTATANSSPSVSRITGRVPHCKPEYLGTFNGDPNELEDFISLVHGIARSDLDPAWRMAVVRTLPLVLEKNARVWYTGLSDEEAAEMSTLTLWFDRMREAFPVNPYDQRREARTRAWVPEDENASTYYFYKLRLLRSAYGSDYSELNLAHDILDGLPATLRVMLRIPRRTPTLQDIREEIAACESMWRELNTAPAQPTRISSRPSVPTSSTVPRSSASASSSAIARSTPLAPSNTRTGPSASGGTAYVPVTPESYDPSCVIPASGGERRKYKRPDNGRILTLNRPCGTCRQDHFDFEHAHMSAKAHVVEGEASYPEEDPDDEGFESSATTEN
ncbi:hypothetical protein CF319_g3495 [Tilletia indica]|nr:hypothetical protein CF319_g3495 [Tilletia indica]